MYRKVIAGLLCAYLIINAVSISIDHYEHRAYYQKSPITTPTPLSILNTMLKQNNLPDSKQIPNCFSTQQQQSIQTLILDFTKTSAAAGTYQLKNIYNYYISLTQKYLTNATLNCLYRSRDFQLLTENYGVQFNSWPNAFAIYVDKNYLTAHGDFVELQKVLEGLDYQAYGVSLDKNFKKYFGKKISKESQWVKSVSNLENYPSNDYFGITVGNGVIGAVSSIKPLSVGTTVLAGAYDVFGRGRVDNIVETFPALQVSLGVAGRDVTGSGYYNYQQQLNMRNGEFSGAFSSQKCSVSYTYRALKNLPFAFYASLTLVSHADTTLSLSMKHDAPDYLNDIQKSYQNFNNQQKMKIMHTKALTKTGSLHLAVASSLIWNQGQLQISHEDWDSNMHKLTTSVSIKKGEIYHFGFITSLISSAHHQDPTNQAIRIVQRALLIGESPLISSHQNLWHKLWENDIVIEGHDEDQKNVRLMLYHCYAFINDFKSYGISPMGLSGLGYNGHVFWDMDLWIYPGILGLNPNLAKTLIQYRYERLQAAKNNAFINGYRGAMFPWQSSKLGVEQTPVWALSGPLQHHISGCVAVAAWNYYCVTQDLSWLKSKGFQIISAVAEFWESRVEKGDDGKYHINNVVAADEWAENVNDDAFTNAIASQSLRIYNAAALKLGLPENKAYKTLSQSIIILKMDNNVTREHSRYIGQNIKQADVNLLSYPLKTIKDQAQIRRDLQFYKVLIPNQGTPAMTFSIFTILYSRLLDPENAYKYFKQSHQEYLKKPFNVFAESKWGTNPYFLTGAGGVIQSLVFGFGGYDITQNGLVKIKSVIPKEWKSVTIKGR